MHKLFMVGVAVTTFGASIALPVTAEARDGSDRGMQGQNYRHGQHGGQKYWYRDGRRYDYNGALAAGIIGGVAAGALLGGAMNRGDDELCTSRERVFDDYTGRWQVIERTGPC